MYGAAAVCSVLLCVLMTGIIVLCIQLSTETHNCQTEIKNFTDERGQLQNNYTVLMKERNQLQKENTDLINKREQLLNENTRLKDNGGQLEIKIANLMEGRNQSLTENTKLSSYTNLPTSSMTSTTLTYK